MLHEASENGHTDTVEALLLAGANVHCQTAEGYSWGVALGLGGVRICLESVG